MEVAIAARGKDSLLFVTPIIIIVGTIPPQESSTTSRRIVLLLALPIGVVYYTTQTRRFSSKLAKDRAILELHGKEVIVWLVRQTTK